MFLRLYPTQFQWLLDRPVKPGDDSEWGNEACLTKLMQRRRRVVDEADVELADQRGTTRFGPAQ